MKESGIFPGIEKVISISMIESLINLLNILADFFKNYKNDDSLEKMYKHFLDKLADFQNEVYKLHNIDLGIDVDHLKAVYHISRGNLKEVDKVLRLEYPEDDEKIRSIKNMVINFSKQFNVG